MCHHARRNRKTRNYTTVPTGSRGSVVDLRHYATSQKVAGSIPGEVITFLNWPNHSSSIMALGSTQFLTEMITRNLPGGKGWPARKGWQPHRRLWGADCLENVGALTSHNPMGLHGLLQDSFTLPHRRLWADCLENVGASTSHNPLGLHGLLQDSFTLPHRRLWGADCLENVGALMSHNPMGFHSLLQGYFTFLPYSADKHRFVSFSPVHCFCSSTAWWNVTHNAGTHVMDGERN
jgi:hypothetical protein